MAPYTGPATYSDAGDYLLPLGGGMVLVLGGLLLAGSQMPSTSVDTYGISESGSTGAFLLGLCLFALGAMVASIYAIAMGVNMGTRGAQLRTTSPNWRKSSAPAAQPEVPPSWTA